MDIAYELDRIISTAWKMVKKGQFISTERLLQKAVDLSTFPEFKVGSTFQLGAFYWGEVGDGHKAREQFLNTVESFDKVTKNRNLNLKVVTADACENLMILSLSFEEFEKWAKRLEGLQPEYDILNQLKPHVFSLRDKGFSWPRVMSELARLYCDQHRDTPKIYPSAAAIYQLMLMYYKKLCLSLQEWKRAAISYTSTIIMIIRDAEQRMLHTCREVDYNEFIFIGDNALPYIREYLNNNPTDQQANEISATLEKALDLSKKKMQNSSRSLKEDKMSLRVLTKKAKCADCKKKMVVIEGMGHTGVFTMNILMPLLSRGEVKGCFKCNRCGRYNCWDCSDGYKKCKCGFTEWQERFYAEKGDAFRL